jgi:hypothetical protein
MREVIQAWKGTVFPHLYVASTSAVDISPITQTDKFRRWLNDQSVADFDMELSKTKIGQLNKEEFSQDL